MRSTKTQFFTVFAFLAVLVAIFTNGFANRVFAQADQQDLYEGIQPIGEALQEVLANYYDEPELDKVVEGALVGMLNSLDEHSTFISAEFLQQLQEDTQGEFEGIGIRMGLSEDGWIMVMQPIEGSPAAKAGLITHDLIVEVDGESTQGISLAEAANRIKGARGTIVQLKVLRRFEDGSGENQLMDVSIKRDKIPIESVTESRVLPDGIGYLRLRDFKQTSGAEVKGAIRDMLDEGMRALVLDLRWNPGGLLRASNEVCELFLPKGTLVTYTKGREINGVASEEMELKTRATPILPADFPLVVLVSEATASSAEIVTGALQYHARALIIGEKTYGKGSVQTIIPLRRPQNSAIKLTTSLYYTPAGVTINERGIIPDVEVDMTIAHLRALFQQMSQSWQENPENANAQNHGSATGNEVTDETVEDNALLKAIEVLNEESVFENLINKYHKDPKDTQIAAIPEEEVEAAESLDELPAQ